jgi:hypothetical protein
MQALPFGRAAALPQLGQDWNVDVFTVPSNGVAWFLGTRGASLPLPPFGTLQLDPTAGIFLLGRSPTQTVGADATAWLTLPIPPSAGLVGLALHEQGLDLGSTAVRPLLANSVVGTIGS